MSKRTDTKLKAVGVEVDRQKTDTAKPKPKPRADTKQAKLIEMLKAPNGATIAEIGTAINWLPHTVRGAMSGALKKRQGLSIVSEKIEERGRVYKIKT